MSVIVHQIGNFHPEYSTENELRRAMTSLGFEVKTFQENNANIFDEICRDQAPNFILWTRTKWSPPVPITQQLNMLERAKLLNVPVIGYHLDRWFGLKRQGELSQEPFFKVTTLYTADGGPHDWQAVGINHTWLTPAIDEGQCGAGQIQERFISDIAFVGSWGGGYHQEHRHRMDLVAWLSTTFGRRVQFWPAEGQPAIRGQDLNDLYASAKVIVGDSCFTGTSRYWSDRIPETLGRGGFLIHPYIEGIEKDYKVGEDLVTWESGNWVQLKILIEYALENPEYRQKISEHGMNTVKSRHTYRHRIVQICKNHVIPTEHHNA